MKINFIYDGREFRFCITKKKDIYFCNVEIHSEHMINTGNVAKYTKVNGKYIGLEKGHVQTWEPWLKAFAIFDRKAKLKKLLS